MVRRMRVVVLLLCLGACQAQRSVWDIILGINREFQSENSVETSVKPARLKTSLKAAQNSGVVFRTSETTTTTTPETTAAPATTTTTTSTSARSRRKIIVNLANVYHCPKSGVFPIDGDCSRFLLCRQGRQGRARQDRQGRARQDRARQDRQGRTRQARLFQRRPKIKGKVYRCPEGYLFSNSKARCKPEAKVACHRSNPLHRLRQATDKKFFLMP